jgi:hypothetical protein
MRKLDVLPLLCVDCIPKCVFASASSGLRGWLVELGEVETVVSILATMPLWAALVDRHTTVHAGSNP